ncbi:MAG TPA: hypothetical protein VFT45_00830, partial [Longimicrobium sp.]|nr:hypothetical protein [Longimicrobium sp.]
ATTPRATVTATVLGQAFTRQVAVLADPSLPGPFPVGEHEYPNSIDTDNGSITVVSPIGNIVVRRKALVRYPAASAGLDRPVATTKPRYPLVFILHGNHRRKRGGVFVESFRGHEPLARHLASHGYVAVSIDGDDINQHVDAAGPLITQRGEIIRRHIAFMTARNATHRLFRGKLDLSRIGLIGHSRGGEGVVAAQSQNVSGGLGLGIKALVSIAPTTAMGLTPAAPYLVLYGSSDGDVSAEDDSVNPFVLYDAAPPPKAMWFIHGAIHNRFSTNADWQIPLLIDNDDGRMLSLAQHQSIALGFCRAFMERQVLDDAAFDLFFDHGERPASVSAVEMHPQVRVPGARVVDNFEQPAPDLTVPLEQQLADRAATNTLTLAVTGPDLSLPEPRQPGSPAFAGPLTEASLKLADTAFFPHATSGALLAWSSATAQYRTELGGVDATSFQVLSFRVGQRHASPRNTPGAAQDFFVVLTDSGGRTAEVQVSTRATIPAPFVRHDHAGLGHPTIPGSAIFWSPDVPALTRSPLRTVRLRLDDFKAANPALDMTTLQRVTFAFRQTPQGEIAIDDIEFSL